MRRWLYGQPILKWYKLITVLNFVSKRQKKKVVLPSVTDLSQRLKLKKKKRKKNNIGWEASSCEQGFLFCFVFLFLNNGKPPKFYTLGVLKKKKKKNE